jgi:hypothetical protein
VGSQWHGQCQCVQGPAAGQTCQAVPSSRSLHVVRVRQQCGLAAVAGCRPIASRPDGPLLDDAVTSTRTRPSTRRSQTADTRCELLQSLPPRLPSLRSLPPLVIGRARRLPRPPPTTKHCHPIAPPGDSPRWPALHFLVDTRLTAVAAAHPATALDYRQRPLLELGAWNTSPAHGPLHRPSPCSASTEVRLLIDPSPTRWPPRRRLTQPAGSTPETAPFHGRSRVSTRDPGGPAGGHRSRSR